MKNLFCISRLPLKYLRIGNVINKLLKNASLKMTKAFIEGDKYRHAAIISKSDLDIEGNNEACACETSPHIGQRACHFLTSKCMSKKIRIF